MAKDLTPNQKIFADEWLKDRNGTRAYKVAYPRIKKDETAKAAASRLLTFVNVKAYINTELEKIAENAEIDQKWVLERYKRLVEYRITDFFDDDGNMKPLSEIPEESLYAIQGLEVDTRTIAKGEKSEIKSFIQKFKLPDKKNTLDSIAKHFGFFEKDNEQKRIKLDDVLSALPEKFREGVRAALSDTLSGK